MAFAQLFTDLGLAAAVVHARRATVELLTTAFWLNVSTGIGLAALVAGVAWPLSRLYGDRELFVLMLIASLNFVVTRGAVQTALLERTFSYAKLAKIETFATATGIIVVPIAAVAGLGAMSLVLGPLVGTILLSASLWIVVPWRPEGRPTRRALSDLWRYSRGLVGFNSLTYFSRNTDTLLLGGVVSSRALGEYNRAFNLMLAPVQQMSHVLARVLFPSLARLRDDPQRLGRAWIRGLEASAALALPVTVTIAATAPALVAVLYGPRWTGMVPVLELLALSAVPQIFVASAGAVFRAVGRTGLLFALGCVSTAINVGAIVLGLGGGTEGVALALLISAWVAAPIPIVLLMRVVGVPLVELARPAARVLVPATLSAAAELGVRWSLPEDTPSAITLVLQLLAGGIMLAVGLWRTNSAAFEMVVKFWRRVKNRGLRRRASSSSEESV